MKVYLFVILALVALTVQIEGHGQGLRLKEILNHGRDEFGSSHRGRDEFGSPHREPESEEHRQPHGESHGEHNIEIPREPHREPNFDTHREHHLEPNTEAHRKPHRAPSGSEQEESSALVFSAFDEAGVLILDGTRKLVEYMAQKTEKAIKELQFKSNKISGDAKHELGRIVREAIITLKKYLDNLKDTLIVPNSENDDDDDETAIIFCIDKFSEPLTRALDSGKTDFMQCMKENYEQFDHTNEIKNIAETLAEQSGNLTRAMLECGQDSTPWETVKCTIEKIEPLLFSITKNVANARSKIPNAANDANDIIQGGEKCVFDIGSNLRNSIDEIYNSVENCIQEGGQNSTAV